MILAKTERVQGAFAEIVDFDALQLVMFASKKKRFRESATRFYKNPQAIFRLDNGNG